MRMKKNIAALAVAATVLAIALTGCDFLRKVAGRPTGAEIESALARREAEEQARHQARLDSMNRIAQAMADSLKALEAQEAPEEKPVAAPSSSGTIRNFIIVGSYAEQKHALRKKKTLEDSGYNVEIFRLKNGWHAVGIEGAATLAKTRQMMDSLKRKGVCSRGSWVYVK